jgi:hypothetical protein
MPSNDSPAPSEAQEPDKHISITLHADIILSVLSQSGHRQHFRARDLEFIPVEEHTGPTPRVQHPQHPHRVTVNAALAVANTSLRRAIVPINRRSPLPIGDAPAADIGASPVAADAQSPAVDDP